MPFDLNVAVAVAVDAAVHAAMPLPLVLLVPTPLALPSPLALLSSESEYTRPGMLEEVESESQSPPGCGMANGIGILASAERQVVAGLAFEPNMHNKKQRNGNIAYFVGSLLAC